ncbi:reverse transcriptase domain-containing protein [Tanacetum coccineum]
MKAISLLRDIAETFENLKAINMKLNPKKCSFGVEEGKFLGYMVTSEGIRANPKKTKAISDLTSPKTMKKCKSLSGKLASLNRFLAKSAERALPFFNTLKNITKENKHEYRWTPEAEEAFQQMKADNIPSIINTTLSEGDTVCKDPSMEMRQSQQYCDRSETEDMPSHMRPKNDFLSDAPDGEAEEEYFRMPEVPPEVDDTEVWTLFTDGAASLKGSGAGLVLIGPSGLEYTYALRLTFVSTNNEAEYEALLAGLRIARKMKVSGIEVKIPRHSIETYREKDNQKADILSKLATICVFSHLTKEILVEVLNERSTDAKEVQTIVEEEGENWMTPIIKYLEEGI